jgi:hypothetical protein
MFYFHYFLVYINICSSLSFSFCLEYVHHVTMNMVGLLFKFTPLVLPSFLIFTLIFIFLFGFVLLIYSTGRIKLRKNTINAKNKDTRYHLKNRL